MLLVGGSDGRGFGGGRCSGNDGGGGNCGSSGGSSGGGGKMGFSARSGDNTLVFVVVAVIISGSAIVCWCMSMRGQKN